MPIFKGISGDSENILQNLDEKLISCTVCLDLRKIFDSVNHSILLTKLEHCGVRGNTSNYYNHIFPTEDNTRSGGKYCIKTIISGEPHS